MPSYELTINGKKRKVTGPEDMPLLWALRDLLNMTGTKFGCGLGQCRACTVHVDGEAVPSCQFPVSLAAGKKVVTIEGLSAPGWVLHRVRRAGGGEDVPRCGSCQRGQIRSACALLAKTRAPSDGDIDTAMSGNICRCGTYSSIRRAIHRAAESMAKTGS